LAPFVSGSLPSGLNLVLPVLRDNVCVIAALRGSSNAQKQEYDKQCDEKIKQTMKHT